MDQQTRNDMPSKSTYTILLVIGFVCGIIWGALSISPYNQMKAAIEAGDSAAAWENAGKIKKWVLIGVVVNALILIGQAAAGA